MAKRITSENKNKVLIQPQTESQVLQPPLWSGIIISLIFIFIITLAGSMDTTLEKWTGLISAAILFLLLILSKKTSGVLKNYITPLFFSVIAYVIWGGISTFYAASGKFAIFEFSKLLVALCVFLTVLFLTEANESGFRKVAYLLTSAGAFFGVISVDAASLGLLAKVFRSIFGKFTDVFSQNTVYEPGIRIYGIFGNANTYAGFMALAVILSLYLVIRSTDQKESRISVALLAVNSLAYLLAFSMGSLFMFLIACLIMLGISEKGQRISLFTLMVETAVITFIFTFLSMIGLGKNGAASVIPITALILSAVLLNLADEKLRPLIIKTMDRNMKSSLKAIVLIIVIMVAYTIAAFTISSSLSLASNESVMRAVYVPSGDYTLSVESKAPVTLTVESQNMFDLMKHTSSILYSGTNEQAVLFTVPDNSKIVKITFASAEGNDVSSAEYSGAANGTVHLNYPLLPGIIANRVQNLFANENVIQRTVFFEDGLKLFAKSPIIGRGLGGFENGAYSVQSFYYETKYTHNHYIQALCDLGSIGLLLFLCILVFAVISLLTSRKKSRALYAIPALAACTFQMFGQAAVDAVWSTGVFLAFAAAILALITIFCSEPTAVKETFNKNHFRLAEKILLAVFTGAFVLLLSGNLFAQAHAKAGVKDFNEIEQLIAIDRFEYNDYKLSYIINAPQMNDDEVQAQADIYASDLMKVESNSMTPYLMAYKYKKYYDADAYEIAKSGVSRNKSNPKVWSQVFDTFEQNIDPVGPNTDDAADRLKGAEDYVSEVLGIYQDLQKRNKESLDDITLTPYNNAFIGKLLEIQATHLYNVDWVFTAMMTYAFDSACAVDANLDGLPDGMIVVSGSVKGGDLGVLTFTDNTVVDLNLYHKLHGEYTFKIETETPQNIKIAYNDQEQSVTVTDRAAFITLDLPDNTDRALDKFTLSFPSAAKVDAITFISELNIE
jgi:hypothetical protein